MAESDRRPTAAQLQQALTDLGLHIAYPPTPDLSAQVRARLETAPVPRRRPSRVWRVAAVLVALLLLLLAALALSSAVRATLSRWFAVRGIVFVSHPAVPTPPPHPVGAPLALGRRVTLAQARREAPFRVLLPVAPGFRTPDEIYFGAPPSTGQVAFVYRARAGLPRANTTGVGLLLTEFVGDLSPEGQFYMKGIAQGTRVERISVNGQLGYWLSGKPHLFFYGSMNDVHVEDVRLAGNTLLWQRGSLTLRLESALGRDQALGVARSVR
jgi:hypothetical protein